MRVLMRISSVIELVQMQAVDPTTFDDFAFAHEAVRQRLPVQALSPWIEMASNLQLVTYNCRVALPVALQSVVLASLDLAPHLRIARWGSRQI